LELEELENNKIDDLYWESDYITPNQVISNLDTSNDETPNISEFEETIPPIPVKKVVSRNVSNSQRRSFR
jgi:hypothetical protein